MGYERIETLVIGGGQAGLAMSHMLRRRNQPHLVLERHRIAERWRSERWAGLRFQFPNWSIELPDFPFRHADPDGFASGQQILDYLVDYAVFVAPPIRCGVAVLELRQQEGGAGFVAETSAGRILADHVVVATGPYQRPFIPEIGHWDPALFQVHASAYREPDQLPSGAVLVVGSGASGAQIAEELQRAGRQVFLSVSRHRRMPRRYRGHDLMWWLRTTRRDQTPTEQRGTDTTLPLITGAYGGHTIDFRDYARAGIVLLGKLESVSDGVAHVAADLKDSLAHGDAAYSDFLGRVDAYVKRNDLPVREEWEAHRFSPEPSIEPLRHLHLRSLGISALVWATGYTQDFGWLRVPALDARGAPVHKAGVSPLPGLYFLGLPWLSRLASSFLSGVGDDARYIADHIATYQQRQD